MASGIEPGSLARGTSPAIYGGTARYGEVPPLPPPVPRVDVVEVEVVAVVVVVVDVL
jgi:hypothetical protein